MLWTCYGALQVVVLLLLLLSAKHIRIRLLQEGGCVNKRFSLVDSGLKHERIAEEQSVVFQLVLGVVAIS